MTDIMKQYNQLQRAYEAQAEENADLALLADQYKAERDALQAKLDELGKQEPVIDFTVLHQFASDQAISYNKLCTAVRMCLAAPKAQEPVKFLVNGARFKLANCGPSSSGFVGFPKELAGRWVALVAADDDCHLKFAAPKALEPQARCEHCDGTGDVHDQTGEWRGRCDCDAGRYHDIADLVGGTP